MYCTVIKRLLRQGARSCKGRPFSRPGACSANSLLHRLGALAALAAVTGAAAAAAPAPASDLAAAKVLAGNHCAVCHTFGKDEPPGQGPNLYNLIGRKAGAAEGFTYSDGFKKALAGQTWDAKLLDKWLTDTQAVAPGSGMVYSQDDAAKRKKLIRFLESLH